MSQLLFDMNGNAMIKGNELREEDGSFYDSFSSLFENSSRPTTLTSYERLLGVFGGNGGNGGMSSCAESPALWSKSTLVKVGQRYLRSPAFLALLPLAVGLVVGLLVGYQLGYRAGSSVGSSAGSSAGIRGGRRRAWSGAWAMSAIRVFHGLGRLFFSSLPHDGLCSQNSSQDSSQDSSDLQGELFDEQRDEQTRCELRSQPYVHNESGLDKHSLPRHIAVIMDGNRRYGTKKYGNATRGHWDGSKTLINFAKWCISEQIQILTVYAFSTENWNRDANEVSSLMNLFVHYCNELRIEAISRGIRIHVISTERHRIPPQVLVGIDRMVEDTKHCTAFQMNICLSYGGRGEIVQATQQIARKAVDILRHSPQQCYESSLRYISSLSEQEMTNNMILQCPDPDIILRTSGEERLSNFLLWQAAYSEFFFLTKPWPEVTKDDLLSVLRDYVNGRKRRYGK